MGLKAALSKPFAKAVVKKNRQWIENPIESQLATFKSLIEQAKETSFGQDHDFQNIQTIKDFQSKVKVQSYEGLKGYIDRMVEGEEDVLWPGKPLYWSKTMVQHQEPNISLSQKNQLIITLKQQEMLCCIISMRQEIRIS